MSLAALDTNVEQVLSADMASETMPKVSLTEAEFSAEYEKDSITQHLLPKGIDGFINARDELAKALKQLKESKQAYFCFQLAVFKLKLFLN